MIWNYQRAEKAHGSCVKDSCPLSCTLDVWIDPFWLEAVLFLVDLELLAAVLWDCGSEANGRNSTWRDNNRRSNMPWKHWFHGIKWVNSATRCLVSITNLLSESSRSLHVMTLLTASGECALSNQCPGSSSNDSKPPRSTSLERSTWLFAFHLENSKLAAIVTWSSIRTQTACLASLKHCCCRIKLAGFLHKTPFQDSASFSPVASHDHVDNRLCLSWIFSSLCFWKQT